jgi:hypothetical protein
VTVSSVRKAIRDYRNEPGVASQNALAQTVLDRLERDPGGNVTAALQRLRSARSSLVIFYLIQAVDLAKSRHCIVSETAQLAADYRRSAQGARELYAFARGKVSMHLWTVLPELERELDENADKYSAAPQRLQIKRKIDGDAAEQLLAMRHFCRRLRDELRIDCSQPHRQLAARWLVEAALACEMPGTRVSWLTRSLGFSRPKKRIESLKHAIPLKRRRYFRLG